MDKQQVKILLQNKGGTLATILKKYGNRNSIY